MKKFFPFIALPALLFTACQSNETGNSKDVAQDQVYRKYEVTIDQETATATASAVFRFAGENGTTLHLSSPSSIVANGVELVEGKLLFGGAYYYNQQPVNCPDGKLTLTYMDKDKNALADEFEIGQAQFAQHRDTFYLGKNDSLLFTVSGGDRADDYELMIRDKENRMLSFYSASNTEKAFVIPGSATDTLATGELFLQIITHKRKDLDNHSTLGGIVDFSCSYKPVKVVAVKQKAL